MNSIDFAKVGLKVLTTVILRPLTLPFTIYKNALLRLSKSDDESVEGKLNRDFPLYIWLVNIYEALIALVYPLGFLWSVYELLFIPYYPFQAFIISLIILYFIPLTLGLMKELLSINLKRLEYLKTIADK